MNINSIYSLRPQAINLTSKNIFAKIKVDESKKEVPAWQF